MSSTAYPAAIYRLVRGSKQASIKLTVEAVRKQTRFVSRVVADLALRINSAGHQQFKPPADFVS